MDTRQTLRHASSSRRAWVSVLCLAPVVLSGCFDARAWVEKDRPWSQSTVAGKDQARVERLDGTELTLDRPSIGQDERGEFLAGRVRGLGEQEVRLDLAGIRTLQVREMDTGRVAAGVAVGLVVVVAAVLYLLHPFLPSL